jgi:ribosomal protein L35
MKTNKSYTKRIRVTKKGKLVVRKPGQNHYNATESGSTRMAKKRAQSLTVPTRIRRRFLSAKSK